MHFELCIKKVVSPFVGCGNVIGWLHVDADVGVGAVALLDAALDLCGDIVGVAQTLVSIHLGVHLDGDVVAYAARAQTVDADHEG